MTTIIQQTGTGRYYTAAGTWSARESEARQFGSSLAALQYLSQAGIRDAVLVMKFSDPRYDFLLHPFGDAQRQATSTAETG